MLKKLYVKICLTYYVKNANGGDNVSVRMVKICDESLVKTLFNIFQFSLETGNFLSNCKRGNIVSAHKKGNRNLISNYRPVSLFVYDTLYNYFEGNDLFSKSQSGFRKSDPCVSKLLPITHEIFKGFDANPLLDTCEFFFLRFLGPLIGFDMRH